MEQRDPAADMREVPDPTEPAGAGAWIPPWERGHANVSVDTADAGEDVVPALPDPVEAPPTDSDTTPETATDTSSRDATTAVEGHLVNATDGDPGITPDTDTDAVPDEPPLGKGPAVPADGPADASPPAYGIPPAPAMMKSGNVSPEGIPQFTPAAEESAVPTHPLGSAPGSRTRRVPSFEGELALELVHLHKSFGDKHAVDDLSMTVPPGVMFGLVGPNGAGKTTTLSMATGLLRPDAGTARVWGHDVWADPPAAKALMGVLPDGLRLFDRLTGTELLSMVGALRRLPPAEVARRSASLLDALDLAGDADTMVADYSAGMAKKIGLACALIHNPRLLLLDEPFESVDPVSGAAIREILDQFVDAGGTVVLSSHVMELVESLCDAVAVVAEGHVLAIGPLDDVRAGESLQQRFLTLVGAHEVERGSLAWLGSSSVSI